MGFYKKILVLKQTEEKNEGAKNDINGIVRVEKEDDTTTLSLSLLNCSFVANSTYFCSVLFNDNPLILLDLGKKPTSLIKVFYSLNSFTDFSVGVFLVDSSITPIAFSKTDNGENLSRLIALTEDKINKEVFNESIEYDDEAVATEDYYSIEEKIKEKVNIIDEWDNAIKQDEDTSSNLKSQEDQEARSIGADCFKDEEKFIQSQNYTDEHSYYQSAKAELDELFLKFPIDTSLSQILPQSKFCKIQYSSDKYYIVGIVFEQEKVKYICYGVPATHSSSPPKELKDFCSFLPRSVFSLQGEGFWVMFQDAITGKCIKR